MKKSLQVLTSILAGITLGMLFAPKKGADLRKEFSKSDDKFGLLGKELLAMGKDASEELQKFLNKKEVKKLIDSGKAKLSDLFQLAKEKGSDLSEKARDELQMLADTLTDKTKGVRKAVEKKTKAVRKTVAKKVNIIKKKIGD